MPLQDFDAVKDVRVVEIRARTQAVVDYLTANVEQNKSRDMAIDDYEKACLLAVSALFT
jgi:hypothetical protein